MGESVSLPVIRRRSQVVKICTPAEPDCENAVVMPRTGLELSGGISFDKWVLIGRMLSAVSASAAWCLGDWLVFGEKAYNGRYRDAIEQTSLDYQTLRNYAWVARRFPLSRRRETLSFGHHAEVASLSEPEQNFWLRKAEALSWSRNKLRREVKTSLRVRAQDNQGERALRKTPDEPGAPADIKAAVTPTGPAADALEECSARYFQAEQPELHLKITAEQLRRCKVMAAKARISVEEWAIHTLDGASR
jgi:hypothetical protein